MNFNLFREIALCGLAIFLCEELKHQRTESPIRPFIVFIVECLQVSKTRNFCFFWRIEMRREKNEFFHLKGQSNQRTSVEKRERVSIYAAIATG